MHSEKKLLEAGAEFVAVWPQEILSHLFPNGVGAVACDIKPATKTEENCGCHVSTQVSAKTCGCDTAPALNDARLIRHDRRLAATEQLGQNIARPAAFTSPAVAHRPTVDTVLLDSIRRIGRAGVNYH
jgi:phosphoglycolate phosphatase